MPLALLLASLQDRLAAFAPCSWDNYLYCCQCYCWLYRRCISGESCLGKDFFHQPAAAVRAIGKGATNLQLIEEVEEGELIFYKHIKRAQIDVNKLVIFYSIAGQVGFLKAAEEHVQCLQLLLTSHTTTDHQIKLVEEIYFAT